MSTARRYLPHYRVKDYQDWDGDWELWQGIAVSMAPSPFGRHQELAGQILFEMKLAINDTNYDAVVLGEIDWIVADDTVVRPDVVVLCGDAPDRHVERTPALVVEVLSPSTAQRDRTFKFDLYRDQGVKHYLILDPEKNSVDVYALDDSGQYVAQVVGSTIDLNLCGDCQWKIPVVNLFP